jgi:hypothetical protein
MFQVGRAAIFDQSRGHPQAAGNDLGNRAAEALPDELRAADRRPARSWRSGRAQGGCWSVRLCSERSSTGAVVERFQDRSSAERLAHRLGHVDGRG